MQEISAEQRRFIKVVWQDETVFRRETRAKNKKAGLELKGPLVETRAI